MNYYLYFHKFDKVLFYIGIGANKRAWDFISGRSQHYKNYIKKYGIPIVEIYKDNLSVEEACKLEIELIFKYGRKGIDEGGILINKSIGGEITALGNKFTEEQKQKISKAKLGSKYKIDPNRIHGSKGVPKPEGFMTPELRKKIGDSNRGKKHSKIHSNKGIPRSEETKKKIGDANRGKPKPKGFGEWVKNNRDHKIIGEKNSKPILQYSLDGILIKEHKSITNALLELGKKVSNCCITSCLKGRQQTAFGFKWKYKKDEVETDKTWN